ncbi:bifunctional methylenetetrahydrofolate dehydrogenase/methenyltetrahydrofolate cyclohydrolase FolD [Candidatus Marinamargulisbacteria bacterium SCGC AG-410-N11]|nr:bifunctional methylenetetrahydrofolate dehydrogenase/methenyltetrahydrofolate cyclohydrolase FolD [Candidatus Marinamargulisbacteria bacterium SCGC AG-410-N11]
MQTKVEKILDGNFLKKQILNELNKEVDDLYTQFNKRPGLAVILVGHNAASKVYVGKKKQACELVGIKSYEYLLPDNIEEDELIELIKSLNKDDKINGILLQLPLPRHLEEQKLLHLIDPKKDVDGFHPENVGKLLLGLDTFKSCTPYGIVTLLDFFNIDTEGKHVVIVGRSNIVGKPLAAMLVQRSNPGNATVTICHSKSKNLSEITKQADILIAAIGQPNFIKQDMVKPETVIIDVGINRVEDPLEKGKYKLVGDVDFKDVFDKSSQITPVPGGVGALTIAMLMKNTIQAFKELNKL